MYSQVCINPDTAFFVFSSMYQSWYSSLCTLKHVSILIQLYQTLYSLPRANTIRLTVIKQSSNSTKLYFGVMYRLRLNWPIIQSGDYNVTYIQVGLGFQDMGVITIFITYVCLLKGSDRLCMVVKLSMQYCGQILLDSFKSVSTMYNHWV